MSDYVEHYFDEAEDELYFPDDEYEYGPVNYDCE